MMPFQQPMKGQLGTSLKPENPGGRPVKIGKPVVLRAPEQSIGFEWAGDGDPQTIKSASDLYFKNGKNGGMPPGLTPTRLNMPQPMEQRRRRAISAGFRNPRGAA